MERKGYPWILQYLQPSRAMVLTPPTPLLDMYSHSGICTLWTAHWCQLYPGSDEYSLWADHICNFLWGASQWIFYLNCTLHKGIVSLSSIWYCCLWYNHCYRYYQPGLLCSLFCIWHLACSAMDSRLTTMVNEATMNLAIGSTGGWRVTSGWLLFIVASLTIVVSLLSIAEQARCHMQNKLHKKPGW